MIANIALMVLRIISGLVGLLFIGLGIVMLEFFGDGYGAARLVACVLAATPFIIFAIGPLSRFRSKR